MKDLFGFRRTNQGSWRGQLGRRPRRNVSMQGAMRGGQVMGMLAASGRHSGFRGQAGGQRQGCGSPLALNYDPSATCNDGSCVFREGCTLIGNWNYNPDAVIDDGSCSPYIPDLCDFGECPVANLPAQFDSYSDYVASTQTPSFQNSLIPSCATGAGILTGGKDPKRGKRFNNACGCGA